MKTLLKFVLAIAIAAALAAWSVYQVLDTGGSTIQNEAWHTNLDVGSADAGLHLRARIAAHGLWALDSSEVIYFTTTTDSAGWPLRHGASYRIEGTDPDTRWWSIAVYNDDHFIPNELDRYSFSKTSIRRNRDDSWVISLSRDPREPNWLPMGDQPGSLALTLRCYNPGPSLAADPGTVPLPRIVQEDGP
jgi:hypothetical protein